MTLSDQPTHKTSFWAPILECLTLVVAGVVLNIAVYPDSPGFLSVHPHPSMFVVIIIGLRYGFRASLISVAITTLGYAFVLLQLVDVPTYLYLLQAPYSTPVVVLVPLGVVVGLLSQRHLDKLNKALNDYAVLHLQVQDLEGEQEELRDVNLELAGRVIGAQGTVGQLYEFAKQLNVVDESKIYEGILDLLKEALGAEKSTVWRVGPEGLEFLACSEPVDRALVTPPNCQRYDHLFDRDGVLALHDLPENTQEANFPFLLGKLRGGPNGEVVAYVALDTIEFAKYSAETVRLFGMVVEWASSSLANVYALQQAPEVAPAPVGQVQQAAPVAAQPQSTKKRRRGKKKRSSADFVPAATAAYSAVSPQDGRTTEMQVVGGEIPGSYPGINAPNPNPAMQPPAGVPAMAPDTLSEDIGSLGLLHEEAAEGTVHRLSDIIKATQDPTLRSAPGRAAPRPAFPDSAPTSLSNIGKPTRKSGFLSRSVTLLTQAGAANPGEDSAPETSTSTSPRAMFEAADAIHTQIRPTRQFAGVDAHAMRTVVSELPEDLQRDKPAMPGMTPPSGKGKGRK
ncbi:MAG: hypothetical protein JKY56_10035 [Kofleriaceae bacterium]|nr:hypothetical protein [Kofleriaceae bacterium]